MCSEGRPSPQTIGSGARLVVLQRTARGPRRVEDPERWRLAAGWAWASMPSLNIPTCRPVCCDDGGGAEGGFGE